MSSSTESSRSIQYISSSSEDNNTPMTFKVRLYHDYKQTAWLPSIPQLDQGGQWIFISTPHGRTYKIEIKKNGQTVLLQRGWNLLVAIENLHEGYKLMFKVEANNKLNMWIHSPPNHLPPIGFTPERIPPTVHNPDAEYIITNKGTIINSAVRKAIRKVWNASCIDGPIYVCHLLISPSEGNFLIFNKIYTALIPKEKANIAMRFIGSNIVMPGAIKTYTDGNARMVKEWPIYATQHYLTFGETFVCKIQRGPAVWEFVGSCVGR